MAAFITPIPLRISSLRPSLTHLTHLTHLTRLRPPQRPRHAPHPSPICASTRPETASSPSPSASIPTSTTSPPPTIFQCPVCRNPLPPSIALIPPTCPTCSTAFPQTLSFINLTPPAPPLSTQPSSQSLFQLLPVSYLYERGWRASFTQAGYPGVSKELDYILDYLPGGTLLDLSCGTGILTRPLARSLQYDRVIAADYSEAMLKEAYKRAVGEFELVRADVRCLPFADASLDAIHAGAALHCWPNVQDGIAEVHRVLKRGGRFVGTTFLVGSFFGGRNAAGRMRRVGRAVDNFVRLTRQAPYRFFEVDELCYLFKAAGFVGVSVEREKGFVLVKAEKGM